MMYDPWLTALKREGERYNLALDSALAHLEILILLALSPADEPDFGTLRGIRNLAPHGACRRARTSGVGSASSQFARTGRRSDCCSRAQPGVLEVIP